MKKISNRELKSNNSVKKLALFYRKNNKYPSCNDNLTLYNFLHSKRNLFKNKSKIYPSDIEVAKAHGLPDDWMSICNEQELKSNKLVKKLALFYRKNNNYPCYKDNSNLYYFLHNKRRAFKSKSIKSKSKIYPSDIEVAKAHGLPDNWLSITNEFESNQKIIEIAQYFKKHGTYPSRKTLLGTHLSSKRSSQGKIYPSDIEVAKAHGLPDDWMLLIDREFESNQRIKELAQEFVRLGDYPNRNTKLGQLLAFKRHMYKKHINGIKNIIWYPSDIEVAKAHGLPDDWTINNNFELESNQKIIEIAQYFKKHGTYPDYNCKIGVLLSNKKRIYKKHINGIKNIIWYPSDIEVAKAHGLPDDWIINNNFELESNKKVIEIAQEFKTHGIYPDYNTMLGIFLNNKRQSFKQRNNDTFTNLKWYPSDIEVAKAHGLPDDWMLIKKQKLSSGERKTNLILEKFNIKPIQQYRHKLCVNKLCLPFDFYFDKDNLHYFIEYNGIQHYQPIYGKTQIIKKEHLKYVQKNDLIKLNFCKKYNYPLLVIPYWIKDFETLIYEFLKTTQFDPTFAQPIPQ